MTPSAIPIMAMLPLALLGTIMLGSPRPAAPPIAAKPVQLEHITERRADAETFSRRWRAVADLPPATVIHEVPVQVVRTVPVVRTVTAPAAPPARIVAKRAMLRQDNICTRHGLRKIEVVRGKWKGWRCRR